MPKKPMRGLFVTGTDTDVGKTYVASAIVRSLVAQGYRVGTYKPVASGCRVDDGRVISDDAVELWQAAKQFGELDAVCPQRFLAPLAPHLAAREERKRVDANLLREGLRYWESRADIVIIEGAGGLLSPLSDTDYVADLAVDLAYPVVVVAANRLGVINHTLQTLVTAENFRSGIEVVGVVLNDRGALRDDRSVETNANELRARCSVPLLAHLAHGQREMPANLDWFEIAQADAEAPGHGLEP